MLDAQQLVVLAQLDQLLFPTTSRLALCTGESIGLVESLLELIKLEHDIGQLLLSPQPSRAFKFNRIFQLFDSDLKSVGSGG